MAADPKSGRPLAMADQMASSIPTNFQKAFTQVVRAGTRIMYSKESHELMIDALNKDGPIEQNIGQGMASLMALMFKKSNGTMPQEVIIPAGIYLIMQGADFLESATNEKITPQILSGAVEAFIGDMVHAAGGDVDKFKNVVGEIAQQRSAGGM